MSALTGVKRGGVGREEGVDRENVLWTDRGISGVGGLGERKCTEGMIDKKAVLTGRDLWI